MALEFFKHSKECNAIHLGLSSGKSKGTGVSLEQLDTFFSYVYNASEELREQLLKATSLPIFVKNFSYDRMSDLLVSLIKKELILYSLEQAKLHSLPISKTKAKFDYWSIETHAWESFESEFVIDSFENMLILIPIQIVNYHYEMTPARYVSRIFTHLQTMIENSTPEGKPLTQKELREREINQVYTCDKEKSYIHDATVANPHYFIDYSKSARKFGEYKSLSYEDLITHLTKK